MQSFSKNPNILQCLDYFDDTRDFCIVTDIMVCDLCDLLIDAKRPLTECAAREIFMGILLAVADLHRNGIIHRDIKLENILLGQVYQDVRLCDFGWATVYDKKNPPTDQCGTFKFTPPEILLRKPYDFKVDSWALGFVLYEILGCGLPFRYEHPAQYRQAILFQQVNFSERKIFEHVSPEAKDLIEKLMRKEPKHRIGVEEALKHPWFKAKKSK